MDISDLLYTNGYNTGGERKKRPDLQDLNDLRKETEEEELKKFLETQLYFSEGEKSKRIKKYNTDYDVLNPAIRNPEITANTEELPWIFDKQNISLSSSVRPVFDNMIKDLRKFRYRKNIISYLNIDSRKRNIGKFPNPGSYNIFIGKEYKYLQSIKLESLEFREAPPPINNTNNYFIWTTDYTGLENVANNTKIKYQTSIPSAFYSLSNFSQIIEAIVSNIQHTETTLEGKFPRFSLIISPFNRSIRFIQRLENLKVNSISTTENSNIVTIRIQNQGNAPPNTNCNIDDTGYPFRPRVESVPIILSGLNLFAITFGNIPFTLLETTPFFPDAPNGNSYTCPTLTYDIGTNEFIYNLEVFNTDGSEALASNTTTTQLLQTDLPNTPAGQPELVFIGRALQFNIDAKCGSFGEFLGLTTSNQFVYVNSNFDSVTNQIRNQIAWKITGTGQLALATTEYILMRLSTVAKPIEEISDNLFSANGHMNEKKDNSFFAKIVFSDKFPGDVSIIGVAGNKFFYNAPLVTLTDLTVQFFSSKGKLLDLDQNHSFTLEMVELREVLKDTLIDSRTGNIADVGAGVATTDPV